MEHGVMIIAPHPDDAELGMGGTIASFRAAGTPVCIVDLSNGEPTPHGSLEKRAAETKAASKILDISDRVCLEMPNRELSDSVENRKKLAAVIRKFKPELLFIPYWEDGHPDHVAASALGVAARFYAKLSNYDIPGEPFYPRKMLHYFFTHIRPKFSPSFVFDISSHLQTKLAAVAAYRSQFIDNPKNQGVLDLVKTEAAYWGMQVGSAYGEPFISREHIKLTDSKVLLHV